ncbi:Lipoprotein LprI [Pandoraea terrae]|uniref:Lipoprotein LprI n=2 Tax=Pandoraea terrae TaxID=1537710 RepID=A0A5E4ULI1_9BURK|nr:Lipoprotein LprI [Pandoraea terrae]
MKQNSRVHWWAGGILMVLALSAHAASFNCSLAKTPVERMICSDKTLNALDADLGAAYHDTLDRAADQPTVMASQRAWVKERNRCADRSCLAQRYRERLAALKKVKQAGWKTWHDPKLGFSFDYLENRRAKTCGTGERHPCVRLVGRDMGNSDYLINFTRVEGPLEEVAGNEAGFLENEDGKWVTTYGRGVPVDVEHFSRNGWNGMRATISCGIDDPETGFHAMGGDCFWAVLSNGRYSIVADTLGIIGTDDDTMRSVESIRFDQ